MHHKVTLTACWVQCAARVKLNFVRLGLMLYSCSGIKITLYAYALQCNMAVPLALKHNVELTVPLPQLQPP